MKVYEVSKVPLVESAYYITNRLFGLQRFLKPITTQVGAFNKEKALIEAFSGKKTLQRFVGSLT